MPLMQQMFFSFMLLTGIVCAGTCFTMATLARFHKHRLALALGGLFGAALFFSGMLVLSLPGIRLYNGYFWLFTIAVIGGALGTVTARNVFHSALLLILTLLGVAGYFILLNAEFLALVQVILYIGGIMVLFLFGIMVSQNIMGTELKQLTPQAPWAAVTAGVVFAFLFLVGLLMYLPPQGNRMPTMFDSNIKNVGWSLMATFTLPFEVASVLLLMALLGAIVLVRKD